MNLTKIHQVITQHKIAAFVASVWFLFGSWFYLHALSWRVSGWYLGHGNVWSDWSLHLSQVNRFAYTAPEYWWTSTYFAGAKFTYPFMSNLLSGLLVRIGTSHQFALIFPSLVFWFATILVLIAFATWVLKSSTQAALAITLFFCSAGIGLLRIRHQGSFWQELFHLSQDYTQFVEYQWGTGNLFLGMFLPQRAFLMGFWIALLAWSIWLYALDQEPSPVNRRYIVGAGVLAGMLPIVHMHSFLAIVILSAPVALAFFDQRRQEILTFMFTAGAVSIPLYLIFVSGGIQTEFFHLQVGWTARGPLDWIRQWVWQWGAMPLVAGVGLWRLRSTLGSLRVTALLSFWFLFLIANLVQFQPVAWDNTKLFLWVYWGFSVTAAAFLVSLWNRSVGHRAAVLILTFLLIVTGAAELLRSSAIERYTYLATSGEETRLAESIRFGTEPNAIFATAPVHNHWVTMWAARPIVMGYSTWVWNFGYDYKEREQDLTGLYTDPSVRDEIIHKYGIDFVVVGPHEVRAFGNNQTFSYPVFIKTSDTTVYDVRAVSSSGQ